MLIYQFKDIVTKENQLKKYFIVLCESDCGWDYKTRCRLLWMHLINIIIYKEVDK